MVYREIEKNTIDCLLKDFVLKSPVRKTKLMHLDPRRIFRCLKKCGYTGEIDLYLAEGRCRISSVPKKFRLPKNVGKDGDYIS